MSDWRTWLLVRDLDTSLDNWVRDVVPSTMFDASARPRVSIRLEGDSVVLRTPDIEALFAYIRRELRDRPDGLLAFSSAPSTELESMHGKEFWHDGIIYKLTRQESSLPVRQPYDNRIFRIRKKVDSQDNVQTGNADIALPEPVDEPTLFLDPLLVSLSNQQAESLLQGLLPSQAYSAITGGCFLPPFRDRNHPEVTLSYFGSDPLRLRHAFRDSVDLGVPRDDEPTFVHLTRLIDDPALRDLLHDGASLHVVCNEGERTAIHLHVSSVEGLCAAARRRMVLDGTMAGPAWAQHVAEALRHDIESIVEAIVPLESAPRTSWGLDVERSDNPPKYSGTWQIVRDEILPIIRAKYPPLATYISEKLLTPASSYRDGTFDHSMLERLLIAHGWRCPWPAAEDELRAWRLALLDLLERELVGKPLTPEQRIEAWNNEARGEARRGRAFDAAQSRAPDLNVRYAGDPEDEDVLFRRLLLPLGTVLSGRTVYLNKGARSQLNAGLVLA